MAFKHTTGMYNVRASLYAWLNVQVTANKPDVLSTATLQVEFPDEGIRPPCWSVHWYGADSTTPYMGGITDGGLYGDVRHGIVEVSCWVTRRDENWRVQLAQMEDAVTKAVMTLRSTGSSITIKDFYASATAPADTSYRIVIDRIEERTPPTDPNPEIERRRLILYFNWLERA
jgi:hypothetical protein